MSSPRSAGSPRSIALVLFAVAVLGSACGGQRIPTSYGNTTQKNFIRGCEAERTSGAKVPAATTATCTCLYAGFRRTIPFSEFKKINEDQSKKPAPLPAKAIKVVDACAKNPKAFKLPAK
ncbi:MAG: hypothetical protein HYX34_06690 [Actinobacteria bacterium]|nr:hypothetical protein [Actinomycetota bacterium]